MADLKKFIDKNLPEYTENDGESYSFPQYEDFLRKISDAADIARIPDLKKKIRQQYGSDTTYGLKNEPTSVESLLSKMGIDKDYLEQLHYRTLNPEPLDRKTVNNKIAELYLQSTHPEALQNMKYRSQAPIENFKDYLARTESLDPMAQENKQYLSRMAEQVVGMPIGETKPLRETLDAYGAYDPNTKTIEYSPEALTIRSPGTLTHELMHRKEDVLNKDYNKEENLDVDFRKGNKLNIDQASNQYHIGLPLDVKLPDNQSQIPVGERPVLFNALKKLLDKEK